MSPSNTPARNSSDQETSSNQKHHVRKAGMFSHNFGTTWRKALVSLPRAVPDSLVLKFTLPDGPHPISLKLPSRDKHHHIPISVFIPPALTDESAPKTIPSAQVQARKCPVLLDFHGGGFILGSCQEQAPFCAKMVRDLNCVAISVDYRLGPYAHFPDAVHDAEDVLNAILHPFHAGYHELRNGINAILNKAQKPRIELDTTKVALSGFSSGGSLAFNLSLSIDAAPGELHLDSPWPSPFEQSHAHPIPIILFYPALDTRLLPNERPIPPGLSDAPKGFFANLNLETELMPTYLPKHLTHHPRASPGLVNTHPSKSKSKSQHRHISPTPNSNPSTSPSTPTPAPTPFTGTLHPSAAYLLILPALDTLSASNEAFLTKMEQEERSSSLTVSRVEGVLHGWTQFPDGWLSAEQRERKKEAFELCVGFLREKWGLDSETCSDDR